MEVKKSKVISVQPNGTWEGSYGTMYKFEILFQDGSVGEYSSKSKDQNKFEVGAETEFEYHGGKYPKIKPHYTRPQATPRQAFGKPDDVQVKIVRQSMLKASIDFWSITPELKPSTQDIFKTANIFIDFVNQKSEPQFSQEFTHTGKSLEQADLDRAKETEHLKSDLPF